MCAMPWCVPATGAFGVTNTLRIAWPEATSPQIMRDAIECDEAGSVWCEVSHNILTLDVLCFCLRPR
jgi:hypothetical protein